MEEGTENKIATPTTFAGWADLRGGAVLNNDGSFYPSQAKKSLPSDDNCLVLQVKLNPGSQWSDVVRQLHCQKRHREWRAARSYHDHEP